MPAKSEITRCECCLKRYQFSMGSHPRWCATCLPKLEKARQLVMDDQEREKRRGGVKKRAAQ